ncbi:MAG TPA: CehA/McbA family metallohydrolase, partial [Limnochordia bacterium]
LDVALQTALVTEPGWISGDHHVHSYCEDGGQSPEAVVRAAAAQGLDYVVVTDEPESLLAARLQRYNRPGRFLALPGQECTNPDVHCNSLNTYVKIPCPAYGESPETYSTPREWLENVAAQSRTHPAALMLNHPSHLPAAARSQPYFRAWAHADANPGIGLVENCDFDSWFARLNAGRRLTALWTTDGHDMAWIPAGTRRSYVYVGEREWDEADIIGALRAGRVFNTRHPGALLYLLVDGKMPGDEVPAQGRPTRVRLHCRATRPLRALELIVNGAEYKRWPGHGALEWEMEQDLALPAGWVLARAYVDEEPLPKDGHSREPMTASGCVAFTNPVYLI